MTKIGQALDRLSARLNWICVLGVPLALLGYGWWYEGKKPEFVLDTLGIPHIAASIPTEVFVGATQHRPLNNAVPYALLLLGGVGICLRWYFLLQYRREQYRDVRSELRFFWRQGRTAFSFSSGLACMLVGAYFMFPGHPGELHHRFDAALGMYAGAVGLTLTAHAFYTRSAPFTDVARLLDSLILDLNACKTRLFIVYPALNIGYYREYLDWNAVPAADARINKYYKSLSDCVARIGVNARAITFPTELYEPLYAAYDRTVSAPGDPKRVADCVENAKHFVNAIQNRPPSESRGKVRALLPDQFPPLAIVIDNIVYTIPTFGLPRFDSASNSFEPIADENDLAFLFTYRREDDVAASAVYEQLEHYWGSAVQASSSIFGDSV